MTDFIKKTGYEKGLWKRKHAIIQILTENRTKER